jgi:regulator of replication initiation timing
MSFDDRFKELKEQFKIIEDNVNSNLVDSNPKLLILVNDLYDVERDLVTLKEEVEFALNENYTMAKETNKMLTNISQVTENQRSNVKKLKNKDAGSIQMYNDIQTLYNQRLFGNILLVCLASYGGYVTFSKKKI